MMDMGGTVQSTEAKLADVLVSNRLLGQVASEAIEALRMADLYLDGFVWVTEPEFSELEAIKAASKRVQRMWAEMGEPQSQSGLRP